MAETAEQPITGLPKKTVTGITANDYILGIDSAEGYQMLIQDLGNYIIQHATSSLMGSNQTIAAALTTLNSNLTPLVNNSSVPDLDDATVHNKVYYFNAGAAHNPGYNYGMVAVWKEANNINQMAWPRGGVGSTSESMSRRSKNGSTGEWGEWVKQPTRAEVDALNNSLPQKPFVPFQTVSAQDYDNLPIGLVYNTGVGEHCPTTSGYILVLTLAFNTDMAKACQFGIDMASTTPKLWYRTRVSQIWRDWKQLVNE